MSLESLCVQVVKEIIFLFQSKWEINRENESLISGKLHK